MERVAGTHARSPTYILEMRSLHDETTYSDQAEVLDAQSHEPFSQHTDMSIVQQGQCDTRFTSPVATQEYERDKNTHT